MVDNALGVKWAFHKHFCRGAAARTSGIPDIARVTNTTGCGGEATADCVCLAQISHSAEPLGNPQSLFGNHSLESPQSFMRRRNNLVVPVRVQPRIRPTGTSSQPK